MENVLIVMPAYKAGKTLLPTLRRIPPQYKNLLLVDDCSPDDTVKISKEVGIPTVTHTKNLGYGGNQKTCYREAILQKADVVVMLHPDGQYDPQYIPKLLEPILSGKAGAVFGSRMKDKGSALHGGMPWWKRWANIFLTKMANILAGTSFSEWHCGFRAYSRAALLSVDFGENSDGYNFDLEMTIKLLKKGTVVLEIPIPTHYDDNASSINFHDSLIYGTRFLLRLFEYRFGLYP